MEGGQNEGGSRELVLFNLFVAFLNFFFVVRYSLYGWMSAYFYLHRPFHQFHEFYELKSFV